MTIDSPFKVNKEIFTTQLPPITPEELLTNLTSLNIQFELYKHQAVFTVSESHLIDSQIPGTHCRNLFLRDKKKNNYLIVLQNSTEIELKKLSGLIGSDRLSFGSPERLWEYLGVTPGSVCPFAILNDQLKQVKIILDKSMMMTERVNYHPMINTMTISLTPDNLLKFIRECGHDPLILDLSSAKP